MIHISNLTRFPKKSMEKKKKTPKTDIKTGLI